MPATLHRLGRLYVPDERDLNFTLDRKLQRPARLPSGRALHAVPIRYDQGQTDACFPAGTLIRMADGSERAIEDVRLLDRVVTAEGRTGRVLRTMVHIEDENVVRLPVWGNSHLRATPTHPVLTARGYVPAGLLVPGDEIAMTRYLPPATRDAAVPTAQFVTKTEHRIVRSNRWTGVAGRPGLIAEAQQLPEKIALTPGVGRLIGLFLAEGWTGPHRAGWSFALAEKGTLAAELVRLLGEEWGVAAVTRDKPAHHVTEVIVHGVAWARLFSALCGDGAGHKALHPAMTDGGVDYLAAVLSGWLDGDGHVRPSGAHEGVTISHDLAMNMYDIAQGLGRRPVITRHEPTMNAAARTRQPRWTVTMHVNDEYRQRTRQTDTHVWRKLRAVPVVEEFVGPVYNLSVEGDESFVAEGIGVHNCTGFSTSTAETGRRAALGGPRVGFNAAELYAWANAHDGIAGAHDGSTVRSAFAGMVAVGDQITIDSVTTQLGEFQKVGAYLWADLSNITAAVDLIIAWLLVVGPIVVGIPWYQDMFCQDPNTGAFVAPPKGITPITGALAGGHAICIRGANAEVADPLFCLRNTWRPWGVLVAQDWSIGTAGGDGGDILLTRTSLEALLSQQGEAGALVHDLTPIAA